MDDEGARGRGRARRARGREVDLISTLPDDLLLRILYLVPCTRGLCPARGCARAAWISTALNTRWRALLIHLTDLTYHDALPQSVLASIHRRVAHAPAPAPPPPTAAAVANLDPPVQPPALAVKRLDICVSPYHNRPRRPLLTTEQLSHFEFEDGVRSLLGAAATLAPSDLRFAMGGAPYPGGMQVNVPCFHRATSLQLQGLDLVFAELSPKCFPSLEKLSLSGCRATISNWVRRSPRLLVLTVSMVTKIIIVRSKSLQELSVDTTIPTFGNKPSLVDNVNIEAPVLKQLTMSFASGGCYNNLLVSVSAPLLEKVSWKCVYFTAAVGLGRWGLLHVGLKPVETNNGQGHLPHIHVLSLSAETQSSYMFSGAAQELRFKAEIKKHMLIGFSMLELRIMTSGHVYGAFALRILGLDGIFAPIKTLKIVLVTSETPHKKEAAIDVLCHYSQFAMVCIGEGVCPTDLWLCLMKIIAGINTDIVDAPKEFNEIGSDAICTGEEACPENCRCEEPKDWRTQSIYLPNLEEVEIRGEDHEFDFWKLVISGAPNLKRVVMEKPSNEVKMDSWRMKIITILGPGIAIDGGCDGA